MTVMELQREISKRRLKRLKGRRMPVVVEAREADSMTGRLLLQAPDVDGIAFIKGDCASRRDKDGRGDGHDRLRCDCGGGRN